MKISEMKEILALPGTEPVVSLDGVFVDYNMVQTALDEVAIKSVAVSAGMEEFSALEKIAFMVLNKPALCRAGKLTGDTK